MMEVSRESILKSGSFFLLAGPCVVESEEMTLGIAEVLSEMTQRLEIPFIFKASYRKANRSSKNSFSGLGDDKALDILAKVKEKFQVPIVTDIHTAEEAAWAAQVADILQIPAFLCRQTDILQAAGQTGKWVNIKKGQFLSAESMQFAANKVLGTGNNRIMLTERGSMFGYQDLIVDMRSFPIMKGFGFPVVIDATHSLQQPNQSSGVTGGKPELIETIARAALISGADGVFIETHPEPSIALSDGANMLPLHLMEDLLTRLLKIKKLADSL